MNPKINSPAFPPQIMLDQFQRAVAPIPGMSQLDHFALQIFCSLTHPNVTADNWIEYIDYSINAAKLLLDRLYETQSETQISQLKLIDNE
jgi:hypothetical protein